MEETNSKQLKKLSLKDGDIVLVIVPDEHADHCDITALQQCVDSLGIDCELIMAPPDIDFKVLDKDLMKRLGWVRSEETNL